MIRLALAVGFLAVFGIVAYVTVLLLTNYFSNKNNQNKKQNP
jgi:Cu/Ag efflux pump CusA